MSRDQIILAVWAFGAVWTWPWFAVAFHRNEEYGLGGESLSTLTPIEWGFLTWWTLAACVLGWPVILSSLAIAKVAKRVAR